MCTDGARNASAADTGARLVTTTTTATAGTTIATATAAAAAATVAATVLAVAAASIPIAHVEGAKKKSGPRCCHVRLRHSPQAPRGGFSK